MKLLPYSIPVALFFLSSLIAPAIFTDSGYGFLVLRSMLEGARFNYDLHPDPADISRDVGTFMTWWSPGQYLVPGLFVVMGMKYGTAVSLTVLICTCIGLAGWAKVATKTGATPFVVFLFVMGLAAFRFNTLAFRFYTGGEILLFAATPWSLLALLKCVDLRPLPAFSVTLSVAVLLFFMKLTGLIVFATTVLALSAVDIVDRRRVRGSIVAMWAASAVAVLLLKILWLSHGQVPAEGTPTGLSWGAALFPVAASAFSGVSGLDLVAWLTLHPSRRLLPNLGVTAVVFAPLGIAVAILVWRRLRHTSYRTWAIALGAIIAIYTAIFIAMYLKGSAISFDERHLRYAGILFFLLFLLATATQPSRWRLAASLVVSFFALYGLASYVQGAREVLGNNTFDPVSATTQPIVSPAALRYVREEKSPGRPIAVVPSPEAGLALPGYRIIVVPVDYRSVEQIAELKWAGRTSGIFILVQERMLANGKAEKLLAAFVDYNPAQWRQKNVDGTVVFHQ